MRRSKSFSVHKKRQIAQPKQRTSLQKQPKPQTRQTQTTHNSKTQLSIPDQINAHINSHLDVEIIVYFQLYKQQYFLKCKRLQQYLYKHPNIKDTYLNEDNPHYKNAFTYLMLDLFRRGVIVAGSYDNLRVEAVEEIENWMLSWVQRKIMYEKRVEEEKEQIFRLLGAVNQMEEYVKIIQVEELPF